MNENLIAGYAAYTTADEYGASATGDAPASVETIGLSIASAALSAATVTDKC